MANNALNFDEYSGREVKMGAFTVTILPKHEVMVQADRGYMVIYPSGFGITDHLAACVVNGEIETLNAIISLHYNILCTVPDLGFYKDLLEACGAWVERNRKTESPDDDRVLDELRMVQEMAEEAAKEDDE